MATGGDFTLAMGTGLRRMAILDAVVGNLDRHGGNALVVTRPDGRKHLLPIDHGLALPEGGSKKRRRNYGNQGALEAAAGKEINAPAMARLRSLQEGHSGTNVALNNEIKALVGENAHRQMQTRIASLLKYGKLPQEIDTMDGQ